MKLTLLVACSLSAFSADALAQGAWLPRFERREIFVGYSEIRGNPSVQEPVMAQFGFEERAKHGWNLGLTGGLNGWLGISFEVSGHHTPVKTGISYADYASGPPWRTAGRASRYTLTWGPQVTWKTEFPVRPIGRALFGYSHYSARLDEGAGSATTTGRAQREDSFVYGAGVGLDWRIKKNLAIRLVQVDFLRLAGQDEPLSSFDYRRPKQTRWSFGLLHGF
jgi:hypothetical protein